jgi:phage-related protein
LSKNYQVTVKFNVRFLEEAAEFLESIDPKAREKIIYNIRKAQVTNDKALFKKLVDEIWEFRTLFNKTHYRLFAFRDKVDKVDTVIISTHGIIKKTNKTPKKEIEKAKMLRELYFKQNTQRR